MYTGFEPKQLKAAGFNVSVFKSDGFTVADLKNLGFNADDLLRANCQSFDNLPKTVKLFPNTIVKSWSWWRKECVPVAHSGKLGRNFMDFLRLMEPRELLLDQAESEADNSEYLRS